MSCGISCIKYLLFIFNFIFALGGLAILIVGVLIHQQVADYSEVLESNIHVPAIVLIVVGCVIFVIAFLGCCGAIRESHCMVILFAVFMLTIVIVQLAIGIYAVVMVNKLEKVNISTTFTELIQKYNENDAATISAINGIQQGLKCCGADSATDWTNGIPWSCCEGANSNTTCSATSAFTKGCVTALEQFLKKYGVIIAGMAIGIAVIEIFGIIFSLCLANSIKNADRRGYRV